MQTEPVTNRLLMSKSQYAAHLGVSKSTVSGYRRRGLLVEVDGLVDVEASEELLSTTWRPSCKRGTTAAPDPWEPINEALGLFLFAAAAALNGNATWEQFAERLRELLDEKLAGLAGLTGMIDLDMGGSDDH